MFESWLAKAGAVARAVALATAACLTGLGPQDVAAFKVETHIWIAQRIINDLASGDSITVLVAGQPKSAKVPSHVREAILGNQQEFLLGSIGPDAFPGIYEGQMTIHPGLDIRGWGTGDWLWALVRRAQTPAEIAFAYGTLVHAASDVFAHSYVNSYAGHIYLLGDDDKLDVEKRHFLLEGYIASKMPPLKTAAGNPAGPLEQLILRNGRLAIPADLLRRALYDDTTAARQWAKNGAPHVRGIHDLHRELTNLSRDNGPLDKLHTLAQKLVVYYFTGMQASDADLKKLNDLHQRLRDYSNEGIDKLQAADAQFRNEVGKVLNAGHRAELDALDRAQRLLREIEKASSDFGTKERAWGKTADDLRLLVDPPCESICRAAPKPRHCRYFKTPSCDVADICEDVCRVHADRPGLEDAQRLAQMTRDAALTTLADEISKYKSAIEAAYNTAETIRRTESKVLHDAVDLLQAFSKNVDPVKGLVLEWLSNSQGAVDAYFSANGEAIRLAMVHESPLPPLKKWVDCQLPAILGVPARVVDIKCTVTDAIAQIRAAMDSLQKLAVKDVPVLRDIEQIRAQIEAALKLAVKEELTNFGSRLLGIPLEQLIDILSKDATADLLNREFGRTSGKKKLVLFDNIAGRIDKEMHLRTDGPEAGSFDPMQYPVVYNAEVLSRLALLDAEGLKAITGIKSFGAGPRAQNIMFALASSIDGNHQWLRNAPPYARQQRVTPSCGKNFGYPTDFALWKAGAPRKLFVAIFKGPLVPGLEIPESLGLPPALPGSYPYRPSLKNPYPNWTAADNKGRCLADW